MPALKTQRQALLASLIGAVIGNLLLGLGAIVGSDTGAPTMVLLRAPLGVRGSFMPTAGASNPSITMIANAYRVCAQIPKEASA